TEMGQKAWNERNCYYPASPLAGNLNGSGNIEFSGVNAGFKAFQKGDLIAMYGGGGISVGHIVDVDVPAAGDIEITPAVNYNTSISPGSFTKLEIIRSGYTNQLRQSTGG